MLWDSSASPDSISTSRVVIKKYFMRMKELNLHDLIKFCGLQS